MTTTTPAPDVTSETAITTQSTTQSTTRTSADWGLTPRERDVLEMVGRGRTNAEIAATMFLSVNTIKTHVRSAYRKVGVTRRVEAVIWTAQHFPAAEPPPLEA